MSKCLVLGANGFIGSHLVDALISERNEVYAFDRFKNGKSNFKFHKNIKIVPGDFLNRYDISEAVRGMDYVFHFISTTTPVTAENDPLIDVDTNIKMSIELMEECTKAGVKKIVFASTGGSIYGQNSGENIDESTTPLPVSPYAIGKLTIEHYLRYFKLKHGLDSVVYRISNPYGERQSLVSKQGVIPIFLKQIFEGMPIRIIGDGSMIRDYVHVQDITRMIALSFTSTKSDVYNLGSGRGTSINELVNIIKVVVEKDFEIIHTDYVPTYVEKIVLNNNRFTEEFNSFPVIGLENGIQKTWQYIQSRLSE